MPTARSIGTRLSKALQAWPRDTARPALCLALFMPSTRPQRTAPRGNESEPADPRSRRPPAAGVSGQMQARNVRREGTGRPRTLHPHAVTSFAGVKGSSPQGAERTQQRSCEACSRDAQPRETKQMRTRKAKRC